MYSVSEYIKRLQGYEEYAFSWSEIVQNCNKTKASLRSELSRLVQKGEIINLRKEFFLIVPPRYSAMGQLPVYLFVEKLFQNLERNYYLGFYSAAMFHGASHQQIQRDYIMISSPSVPDVKKNNMDIRFLASSNWPKKNILEKSGDAGMFKISSPALTAVDLIHFQNKLGGLSRMLTVLEELIEEIDQQDLADLLTWYPYMSTLQRFGYLLEEYLLADKGLIFQLMDHLKASRFFPVLLSPLSGQNPGTVTNPWRVDVNIQLESNE
jgi:predicted transcriptional regulator of viral defense system